MPRTFVILGATGRTGRLLVERALAQGVGVRALVRRPEALPIEHERLDVVRGDVMDPASIDGVIPGAAAVLSALGHSRSSPRDMLAVTAANLVSAMERHGVRRLVAVTGAGVRDAGDRPGPADRFIRLLLTLLAGGVLRDSEAFVERIRSSSLAWTIVRVPMLGDGPASLQPYVGPIGPESGVRVSRADLARTVLAAVDDERTIGTMPVVSSGREPLREQA